MNIKTDIINSSIAEKPLQPKALLEMLADPDLFSLWQSIRSGETVPRKIMAITRIPQTTVYRKLTWLLDNGIIRGIVKDRKNTNDPVKLYSVIEDFSGNLNAKGQTLNIKLWRKEDPLEVVTMRRTIQ